MTTPTAPTFTVAGRLRKALKAAAETALAGEADVKVVIGSPYPLVSRDYVVVGDVRARQEPAALGGMRPRDEYLDAEIVISSWRPGRAEQETVVTDRVYDLLGKIERHIRMTDTTLGGLVLTCALTEHQTVTDSVTEDNTDGRAADVLATFSAHARITG